MTDPKTDKSFKRHSAKEIFDLIFGNCSPDSFIALGSRRAIKKGQVVPHYLTIIKKTDLEDLLPGIFEWSLEQFGSQYFVPNTFSEKALTKPYEQYKEDIKEIKPSYFGKKNRHIKELCALVLDLDVGREENDLTSGAAVGQVIDMAIKNQLPIPSLYAYSGRGAYVIFLLQDETTNAPPINSGDNSTLWELALSEIVQRCSHLKADKRSPSQLYKRPDTVDTKTGNIVFYLTVGLSGLKDAPRYSLPELVEFLKVHTFLIEEKKEEKEHKAIEHKTEKRRLPGGISEIRRRSKPGRGSEPARMRIEEIEKLNQYRKGMPEGCRYLTLLIYFQACWRYFAGKDKTTAFRRAEKETYNLNNNFKRPLGFDEIEKSISASKGARKLNYLKNKTVCDLLYITEKECYDLNLKSLVPEAVLTLRKMEADAIKKKRKEQREKKRDLVKAAIDEGLTNKEIAKRLGVGWVFVKNERARLRRQGGLKDDVFFN